MCSNYFTDNGNNLTDTDIRNVITDAIAQIE